MLGFSVTKELLRKIQVQQEISTLEAQIDELEQRNNKLHDIIAVLNTSSAQDKNARVKLNVQAPGEQVVFFTNTTEDGTITLPDGQELQTVQEDTSSNPKKWYRYFFGF